MTPPPRSASVPQVSVVIVSYNTREELLRCVRSYVELVSLPSEIIVVDNASRDGSSAALTSTFPQVRTVDNPQNVGFSRANNQGLQIARAAYVLILNSDTELRAGSVETMADVLDRDPGVAIVGPRTLNSDGTPQVSYGPQLTLLSEWRQRRLVHRAQRRDPLTLRRLEEATHGERSVDWVSGSCMLARREALSEVGGFDEGFFLYEEDVDLCLRLRQSGWKILFSGEAEIVHHLGRSVSRSQGRARLEYHRSHLRYYRKHNGPLRTALLRTLLGLRGALGLLRLAAKPASQRAAQLPHWRALLSLAWRGR